MAKLLKKNFLNSVRHDRINFGVIKNVIFILR